MCSAYCKMFCVRYAFRMVESLRDQQKRVARERLLIAAADEIVENGTANLSLLAIAERAGVSERTLYNYFKTRENLLAELNAYSSEMTMAEGGREVDSDPDRLPDTLKTNWATWQSQGNVIKALILLDAAASSSERAEGRPGSRARTASFREGIASVRPDLNDDQLDVIAAFVRSFASGRTWYRMTEELGVPSEPAAAVAAWAYEVLRDALRDGRGPFDD